MKKVFSKFVFCIFFLSCFSLKIFAQEVVIVDSEDNLYEQTLKEYNEYSSLLKKHFSSQQDEFLKSYAERSYEIYSIENAFGEIQNFLIAESLFYWNYFRKNINDDEAKKIIDKEIIDYWNYLNENIILDNNFLVVYNYVEYFLNLKNIQIELPISEFKITDFNFEKLNIDYELPSDVFVRNDFYQTITKAESLLFKLNKEVLDVEIVLSEETFYKVLNNPKLLFVIFNNEKYFSIKESFCKTAKLLYDVEVILTENKFDLNNIYSFFSKDIFEKIYFNLPSLQKSSDIEIQYEFVNSFSDFMLKQIKEGFDIEEIFSPLEFEVINKIIENNYFAFCVDVNFLKSILDKINLFLSLECPTELVLSNLKVESGEHE